MMNELFLRRVAINKIYWLSIMAAFLLLLCSIVHTDVMSGEKYTFLSLFYNEAAKEALQYGQISIKGILIGRDTSYLWMFCPIIVGIPCVLTQKVERFVLFRISKNNYFFSKYISNLLLGGFIMLGAYLLFAFVGTLVTEEIIWDLYLARKLLSVFCWGMINTIFGIVLSEFMRNKYLILCIPFVLNYFLCNFLGTIVPYDIWKYVSPDNYQILFLHEEQRMVSSTGIFAFLILACGVLIKVTMERRCDCGQW